MSEYIEREKLIEHLRKDPLFDLVERHGITGVIESIPAAEVRPVVHGEWKFNDPLAGDFMCDNCFERQLVCSNYCPNCGADMREES